MGSADLHGLAALGIDLLLSRCTASNVQITPIRLQIALKEIYMMIGI
jgi:hypothetical protein